MSTTGNIVFLNHNILDYVYEITDDNISWDIARAIHSEQAPKIYIHHDMYPSGIIPLLLDFLNIDGAKSRYGDSSYLSAWFIAYYCMEKLEYRFIEAFGEEHKSFTDEEKNLHNLRKAQLWNGIGIVPSSIDNGEDFTYVLMPDKDKYMVLVFKEGLKEYIGLFHSDDDIEDTLCMEDWWY